MGIDDVFAVIAEGTRRQILKHLRDGDKAVGELVVELQVSQPTVSKHLKVLREAGLVSMRAQGQKRYYSLDTAPLGLVRDWLAEFDPRVAEPGAAEPAGGSVAAGTGSGAGPETASDAGPDAVPEAVPEAGSDAAPDPVLDAVPDVVPEGVSRAVAEATPADAGVLAAAVLADPEVPVEQGAPRAQIGRTMGRAAERAADLLSQLRRRRDS
ncbi:ArsR/SmtB family transcription factor [Arthrobacter sp. MDT3-44]